MNSKMEAIFEYFLPRLPLKLHLSKDTTVTTQRTRMQVDLAILAVALQASCKAGGNRVRPRKNCWLPFWHIAINAD